MLVQFGCSRVIDNYFNNMTFSSKKRPSRHWFNLTARAIEIGSYFENSNNTSLVLQITFLFY